jgi:Cd2+/Zn2+-exporting ATPase
VPYFVIGYDVLWRSVCNILHGQVFDENFLMSIATIGAMFTSEYAEGVAVMLFYQVGELFQSYAVGKSRRSISALMDIRPDHANVIRGGETVTCDPEEVEVGEIILIRPGERVPLDAVVIEGETSLNTSALTGESVPRDVTVGDDIISGSVNLNGVIRAKVRSVYGESTVARILDLVENSADKKAKTENFITKFAKYYTPAVVISAVLLAIVPPLIIGGEWSKWIHRALVFLVVSCPCALVISVPLSFFGGIGGAAKRGILVKGSNFLETLSKANTVVFDKTGTLTKGTFRVTGIYPEGVTEDELVALAAGAETYSSHPIALAIREAAGDVTEPEGQVQELAGMGVKAIIGGKTVSAGNGKLMNNIGATFTERNADGTVVYVAVDGVYAGCIVISDEVKEDSAETIKSLHDMGISHVAMLTGDHKSAADNVGKALGVDEICSELMPADKVAAVERMISERDGALVFVGDGINDAPVLTRADVGVAMGALGSDAAIEAADIVLMDDKPSKLAEAIGISKRTMGIVWQNIIFALAVKLVILVLGALGIAGMWLAVFADVGVAVIAILNAMRAMNVQKK